MEDSFSTDLVGEAGVVRVVMQAIGSNGEQWFLFSSLKAKQCNYTRQDVKVNKYLTRLKQICKCAFKP